MSYKYLGASIVVEADHPAVPAPLGPTGLPEGPPSGRLTYAGAASGDYSGLDPTSRPGRYARASRFGRVIWQRWLRTFTKGGQDEVQQAILPALGGNVPVFGFYAWGELGRIQGRYQGMTHQYQQHTFVSAVVGVK